jgi:hypothetical protein
VGSNPTPSATQSASFSVFPSLQEKTATLGPVRARVGAGRAVNLIRKLSIHLE